tara:strand:+ start:1703 stop:1870 length:168 start_codon:yes stop_codon:yes gene_type:complete
MSTQKVKLTILNSDNDVINESDIFEDSIWPRHKLLAFVLCNSKNAFTFKVGVYDI